MSGSFPITTTMPMTTYAAPMAVDYVDVNNDGRADRSVAGADFNRDGIVDAMEMPVTTTYLTQGAPMTSMAYAQPAVTEYITQAPTVTECITQAPMQSVVMEQPLSYGQPAVQQSVVMQQPGATIVGRSSVTMENVTSEFRATHERLPDQTMMGTVRQVKMDSITEKHMEMARYSEIQTSYMSVREQGAPVYAQGQTIEEQGHAMITTVREEQVVAGQAQTQTVETPTEEVQVNYVDVPEVQVVQKTVERTVERVVEEIVEVPRVEYVDKIVQRAVEQIIQVPKVVHAAFHD